MNRLSTIQCFAKFKFKMSQSNMYYSGEELIISDEEMDYFPQQITPLQSLPPSNLTTHFISTLPEEAYLRDYIDRHSESIGRTFWLDSPTTICCIEDMEPQLFNLDSYGAFSDDEMDNMEAQYQRFRDREARLNYYTSSDEGIPDSAFDDTSSVGTFVYDDDDEVSVLLERWYDEWEEKIKWTVEDSTDPDEPLLPQKKPKTNKETKTTFSRQQRKQVNMLSVKEQTEGELTKREKKEMAKFNKSTNIQSAKYSKIKKSKEIQRQRTSKYAQLTQSPSTLKEELYDMYSHHKNQQKDEKSAAEIENANKKKNEKRAQVFLMDSWQMLEEFKEYERKFIAHMDIQGVRMTYNDLHFKHPRLWPYRFSPLHIYASDFTYIPRKIRRHGQRLLNDEFWKSSNYTDYFEHKPIRTKNFRDY